MNDKFMSTVKIGSKGQIIIPKEIRDMFDLDAGDQMIILADKTRGIALQKSDLLKAFMDSVFDGKNDELLTDSTVEEKKKFSHLIDNEMKGGEK